MASRLNTLYKEEVLPALMKEFNYKNVMQAPKLEKIVVNVALGEAKDNVKLLESAVEELRVITGQQPVVTKAKKSVSNFKLREGQSIGTKVTLRGKLMEDFYDKLVNIALPRVRDFRGVSSKSFDGRGNYALGVKEQLIFPEIVFDQIDQIHGMDIIIVTTAETDEEGRALLSKLGMPFEK